IPEATISLAVMISGALLLAVNALVIREIARMVDPRPAVRLLATAATVLYYPLVYWTLRGMEVGLVALLVSASVLFGLRVARAGRIRDVVALAVVIGSAVLTRTDAVLLMLVVVVFTGLTAPRRRRVGRTVPLAGALLGALVGLTVFREVYYHA